MRIEYNPQYGITLHRIFTKYKGIHEEIAGKEAFIDF